MRVRVRVRACAFRLVIGETGSAFEQARVLRMVVCVCVRMHACMHVGFPVVIGEAVLAHQGGALHVNNTTMKIP